MEISALWDGLGAVIVLGGTLLAVLLGSGSGELGAAARAIGSLVTPAFNQQKVRAQIARNVEDMRRDGLLRSVPCASTDSEITLATNALIHDRSLHSLLAVHRRFREDRQRLCEAALRPIRLAAEAAPVFGMVGTLLALSQMQLGVEGEEGALVTGIAMAILTTLYGLVLAHLVFHPLARAVDRRGEREEQERQQLFDWLSEQLSESCPPSLSLAASRSGGGRDVAA
ncbi:MotA/TolQ/ExbB proton channel family protein [Alteraurantiacibacter aquimixticola]|uniref:Chemotaxis protein MotA n=1 Tax=Alteraurantiacibacter aquimixticola TaxID=2489173 RepID=A0A4T3F916_9SPHN|nr:MotA/TolQ/ExbB proton channel family protein [Alteraurantiacibacter aquimixticola]TIX51510.1 chemotaxis protein MotA [Alteraurantiacibacter aquimixticola]